MFEFVPVQPLTTVQFRRKDEARITPQFQVVLLSAGLRGAIAFALSVRDTSTEIKRMQLSMTLTLVLVTVLVFGGGTAPLIKLLKVKFEAVCLIASLLCRPQGWRAL
jgi:sodium/hydrogen exchanger-like protein 6/7